MAEYLASIFGTEKDKVNCSFYFKIGACRHGEGCSRLHNKPTFSQTILMQNLYQNPATRTQNPDGTLQTFSLMSEEEQQEYYDTFFEDVFIELEEKYGEIEELNVCDNLGDHLIGNVYVKFRKEEDAEKAVLSLNNRWFNGQPIRAELSHANNFLEISCRQFLNGDCNRGSYCGFMHFKQISEHLHTRLYGKEATKRSYSHSSRTRRKSESLSTDRSTHREKDDLK